MKGEMCFYHILGKCGDTLTSLNKGFWKQRGRMGLKTEDQTQDPYEGLPREGYLGYAGPGASRS